MQDFKLEATAIELLALEVLANSSNEVAHRAARRLLEQLEPQEPDALLHKLTRPILFFDLETTGTDTTTDRIVQIALTIIYPNGKTKNESWLVNPGTPIPAGATAVHGINDEAVKDAPPFTYLAPALFDYFTDVDLGTFNGNKFDIPLLAEEFGRCRMSFPAPGTLMIDVSNIFRKKEPRTLAAAVMFYTGQALDGAHDAGNDVAGTVDVLNAQLAVYPDLAAMSLQELHQYSKQNPNAVDLAGKLATNAEGVVCWTFGKHAGKPVTTDPGYIEWVLGGNFPSETKAILRDLWLASM